jgi:hypothetical protein
MLICLKGQGKPARKKRVKTAAFSEKNNVASTLNHLHRTVSVRSVAITGIGVWKQSVGMSVISVQPKGVKWNESKAGTKKGLKRIALSLYITITRDRNRTCTR